MADISPDDHNKITDLVQNLCAHLGSKPVLALVNIYEKNEKADLTKEEYETKINEAFSHLFHDTPLPEDFPQIETVKADIEALKSFIKEKPETLEYTKEIFESMIPESLDNWPNAEGGRRRRNHKKKRRTHRKKRQASKKKTSRRRHK